MKTIFVIGKGGVGKTTCAAAAALLSSRKQRTLVVSLDPAHNLGDVLGVPLSGRAQEVAAGLWAGEVDMEAAISSYLEESARKLKDMYGYLKALNIEGYLDTIRLSPGIEEYATLEAVEEILAEGDERYELIVFDTPPTGLTLRVLALPKVSLLWGDRLMRLRREILNKRAAVEKIHGERRFVLDGKEFSLSTTEEKDGVMQELLRYTERVRRVNELQTDPARTTVMPVMNPDRLSLFETARAFATLEKLNMPVGALVVNKCTGKKEEAEVIARAEAELQRPARKIPLLEVEPVGMDAVEQVSSCLDLEEWLPHG